MRDEHHPYNPFSPLVGENERGVPAIWPARDFVAHPPPGLPHKGGGVFGYLRMSPALIEILEWYAAGAATVAAAVVALDLGRRPTGWAMVLFVTSSIAFIAYGLLDEEGALTAQNFALLAINLIGVYRYLIRKPPPHAAPSPA